MISVLPGQTFVSGSAIGNTPTTQTAGSSFNVDVYAVNSNGVTVDTNYSGSKNITFSGPTTGTFTPTTATAATFTSGKATIAVTLNKAADTTLTATDGTLAGQASSSVSVNAGAINKLQVLMPGETAVAGSATGKSGTPTAQVAGTATTVTVNSVDANWNVVSSTKTLAITSSDTNATLPANAALVSGTQTYSVTFKTLTASGWTVTATDTSASPITANTSTATVVNAGAATKLQVLMPGETAAPGTATGKTGTPTAQTAGTATTVTVNSVDANWNLVSSSHSIAITSSDPNATLPGNSGLSSGTKTYSVTFKTANPTGWTVTATDTTAPLFTANTGTVTPVNAGTAIKLQLLMPGETAAPGTSTGKTGTPTAQTAGTPTTVTVNSVDTNWNVASTTRTVAITSTDANAALPANAALVAGTQTFSATFKTSGGTKTITATDTTSSGPLTPSTSPATTVNAGAFAKLQLLVPGEVAAAGTATGKTTATPTPQNILAPFNVTVNAVDANWNKVSATDAIALSSTDSAFTSPGGNLVAGTATISATFGTTGAQTITATDTTDDTKTANTSPSISVQAVLLKVTLPGETFVNGSGNTGTPTSQVAGTAFTITLSAVNDTNTIDTNYAGTKTITYSGPGGSPTYQTSVAFTSGQGTASITLKKAETVKIAGTDGTRSGVPSSSLTVTGGSATKLQILLPGEIAAPGTTTGKTTGTPTAQVAGTAIANSIIINAVDANWNVVTTANPDVAITSSDANAAIANDNGTNPGNITLTNGTATFSSLTFKTAGSWTVTGTDAAAALTASTSGSVTVAAGAATKLQVLMPGETAAPGTATGKTGSPTAQLRGASVTITVNSVDANWNVVSSTHAVAITSSDTSATLPANAALSSGTKTFAITFNTANTTTGYTVTATDQNASPYSAGTSAAVIVNPNPSYKSRANGNWSDFNTWSIAPDGVTFVNATTGQTPTAANSDSIQITGGFTVTVTAGVTIDQTTVDAGSTVSVNSSTTLTIAEGTGTDLDVSGTVASAGTITPTGTIVFESGGRYQHNQPGGAIPISTWVAGSTCEYTGATTSGPSGSGLAQAFANFTWNCPSQSQAVGNSGNFDTANGCSINGNLTIQNTNGQEVRFGATQSGTVSVGGNLVISGGALNLSSGTGARTMNVSGNVSVTSGALTVTTLGNGNIHFAKAGTQLFTSGATVSKLAWIVDSGSTVDFGASNVISGTSVSFTLSSGGGIITANAGGLNGCFSSVTPTLGSGGNYTFNGAAAQVTGTLLPVTINNLTIANTVAAVSLTSNETVNGTLTVNSGASLDFNSKTITTPKAPSLAGALTMSVTKTGTNTFTGSKLTQTAGTLAYGGTLAVNLVGGTLAAGDSIPLFVVNGTGAFANAPGFTTVTGPTTPSSLTRDVSQLTGGTGGNIIFRATPTLSVTNSPVTYNGSAQAATVVGSVAGTVSNVQYAGSSTVPTNAGTYSITADFAPNDSATYNSLTGASAGNFVINQANVVTGSVTFNSTTSGGVTTYTASGPAASYAVTYSGRSPTVYPSSSTAPTAPGLYTATATSTDPNYAGSDTKDYFIAGPVAVADNVTKNGNGAFKIPVASLLQNDYFITNSGTVQTTGLSMTAVQDGTAGTTNYTQGGAFIFFTPSTSTSDNFTYTLSDGVSGDPAATGAVTVVPLSSVTPFNLAGTIGTATYDGYETTITLTFTGTPDQTYHIYYKGDLNNDPNWIDAGGWYSESGTFSVTIMAEGDHTVDWNNGMFFQGVIQ